MSILREDINEDMEEKMKKYKSEFITEIDKRLVLSHQMERNTKRMENLEFQVFKS